MSVDVVDDLHSAEDTAGALALVLEDMLNQTRDVDVDKAITAGLDIDRYRATRATALARVEGWQSYCRPSCGADGEAGKCESEDPTTCGCPCGHADLEEDDES